MSGPGDRPDRAGGDAGAIHRGGPPGFYDQEGPGHGFDDSGPVYHDPGRDGRYDERGWEDDPGWADDPGWEGDDGTGWPVVDDVAAPAPTAHRVPGRRARRPGHRWLKVLAVLVVVVVVLAGAGLVWAQGQIDPGGHRGPSVTVVIPKGASTTEIGHRLAAAGVIHDGSLFALYVRLHGYGPLYPGTYRLAKNSPYSAAISALRSGPKILTENLVIPEGYTVAQIAQAVGRLPHMGLSAQKFLAAATNGSVRSPYEPAGVNNLEGLLFPATYQVRQGQTTEVDLLEEMVGTFDERVQGLDLPAAAAKLHLTPYQVITVASIVEREAKLPGDRPNVASAIYNRLRIGMKLGADSTQTYYLRLSNPSINPTPAQLDQPSPYNTRTNPGLPPTPISNPGMASLEAAVSPASTNYLYFVEINPDGQLGFASSNSGFQRLQQQCQAAGLC